MKPIHESVDAWGLPEDKQDDAGSVLAGMLDDLHQDRIPGGLGDKKKPSDFPLKQVLRGLAVEMEHTNDPIQALEIALDHLSENESYYTDLEKTEKSPKAD